MEMLIMQPTAFTPARPRPLSDIEFCAWIGQAMPGDRLEYHRGFLGIDAMAVISTLPEPERRQLGPVAVWCRSFDNVMCSKGDDSWAQEERTNFVKMRCELH